MKLCEYLPAKLLKPDEEGFNKKVTKSLSLDENLTPLISCLDKYNTPWRLKPRKSNNFIVVR